MCMRAMALRVVLVFRSAPSHPIPLHRIRSYPRKTPQVWDDMLTLLEKAFRANEVPTSRLQGQPQLEATLATFRQPCTQSRAHRAEALLKPLQRLELGSGLTRVRSKSYIGLTLDLLVTDSER